MDNNKSNEILKAFGNPVIHTGKTNLVFARQSKSDISDIEAMSDEELIQHWKNLNWMNYIAGNVSLNELQRISLLELEMNSRPSINQEELSEWYKQAQEEFDNNESQF